MQAQNSQAGAEAAKWHDDSWHFATWQGLLVLSAEIEVVEVAQQEGSQSHSQVCPAPSCQYIPGGSRAQSEAALQGEASLVALCNPPGQVVGHKGGSGRTTGAVCLTSLEVWNEVWSAGWSWERGSQVVVC